MLDKVTRMAWLYDFYGQLLTKKQRSLIELYYHQDLSLGEIAAEYGVSRQAVHDLLKRAETILEAYEKSLGFFAKFWHQKQLLEEVQGILAEISLPENQERELQSLLESIIRVYQEP